MRPIAITREDLHRKVFFFTAILFAVSLPFAEFMISIASGLVFVQSLFFFRWADRRWADRNMWIITSVFGIYLAGCIFTNDSGLALYELRKTVFWLIIPVGIALTPKLTDEQFWIVLLAFIGAVTLSSFISVARLIVESSTVAGNFREVHFVSHISYSLQVILAFLILFFTSLHKSFIFKYIPPYLLVVWALWLLVFLVLLKSIVGLVAFYFTSLGLIFYLYRKISPKYPRFLFLFIFIMLWLSPMLYVGKVASDYFTVKDIKPENGTAYTINGNPYTFDFSDKQKENGYYTRWFLCEEELIKAWNERSDIKYYEADAKGYTLGGTLIRYMTGKGLKKDSAGVAALTDQDIKNIESGMANPIFGRSIFSIYPRIYETIWEIDYYLRTGNPNEQSLSQRIEYNKAALLIIKEKFFFGIGTGNYIKEYHRAHVQMNSKLVPERYGIAHNQYLNHIVKFGIVGLLWILFVLVSAVIFKQQNRNSLLLFFLAIYLIANFGENNFETHVGLPCFLLFYTLFLWHSPKELYQK